VNNLIHRLLNKITISLANPNYLKIELFKLVWVKVVFGMATGASINSFTPEPNFLISEK